MDGNTRKTDGPLMIMARIKHITGDRFIKDVLHRVGVKKGTWDSWVKKDKIPDLHICEICIKLGIREAWLRYGDGEPYPQNSDHTAVSA